MRCRGSKVVFRQPLPSTGSLGLVPPLPRYYALLRLPVVPPAALRCLRLAVPPQRPLFVSPGGVDAPPPGRGSLDRGFPNHADVGGDDGASQVPGGSPCPHALLSDPGGTANPCHSGSPCCLPLIRRRRLPRRKCLSGLHHTACGLPVYASQGRSPFPTQHSVPAAGQLCRAGLDTRWTPLRGFRCLCHPSSSPKLCLAHRDCIQKIRFTTEQHRRLRRGCSVVKAFLHD